jgi:hypothetical protein
LVRAGGSTTSWVPKQDVVVLRDAVQISASWSQTDSAMTQAGLLAWTDRLVKTGITTVHRAVSVRQQFKPAAGKAGDSKKKLRLERQALNALDSLLPKASMSVGNVCQIVIAYVNRGSFHLTGCDVCSEDSSKQLSARFKSRP